MTAGTLDTSVPVVSARPARRRRRRPDDPHWQTYAVLIVVTLISIFPLYYTVVMASHSNADMAKAVPPALPNSNFFHNVSEALKLAPLNQGLINSFIVATAITIGTVFVLHARPASPSRSCTSGAPVLLGLRRRHHDGADAAGHRSALHADGHGSIWRTTCRRVILPTLVTAFGVFFMRQYLPARVPDELIEAGRMDGAGTVPHLLVGRRPGRAAGDGRARRCSRS